MILILTWRVFIICKVMCIVRLMMETDSQDKQTYTKEEVMPLTVTCISIQNSMSVSVWEVRVCHGLTVAVLSLCISSYIMAAVSSHPQTVRRLHRMCLRHRSTAANPLHQHTSTVTLCSLNSCVPMRQISLSWTAANTHAHTHKVCVYVTRNPSDLLHLSHLLTFAGLSTHQTFSLVLIYLLPQIFCFSTSLFPPLHLLSCLFCTFAVLLNIALQTFLLSATTLWFSGQLCEVNT